MENVIFLQRNNYPIGSRAKLNTPHTPSDSGGTHSYSVLLSKGRALRRLRCLLRLEQAIELLDLLVLLEDALAAGLELGALATVGPGRRSNKAKSEHGLDQ